MFKLIFVLLVAGAHFGTVSVSDPPTDRATCLAMASDPETVAFVQQYVKAQTGVDVEVEGVCKPAGSIS
jgi:hypothetical protein